MSLRTGLRVAGHYELIEPMPFGRLGPLWFGSDIDDGKNVVIRFLSRYYLKDRSFVDEFVEAGDALVSVAHPNVVVAHAAGVDGALGAAVLVTGYVPGVSLQSRIDLHQPLHPARAAQIGAEVCAGLAHLHAQSIVHGDLRPSAIRIASGGRAILLDPGMPYGESLPGDEVSPRYVSPHYLGDGDPWSVATDLYAVAAVLRALVCGKEADRPVGPSVYDDVPRPLSDVLARAAGVGVGGRIASAAELMLELRRCVVAG
jgi:serine/threonine protein kinase